jgi:hypothetical protein
MSVKQYWPSWRYGPNEGDEKIFEREEDVPVGWFSTVAEAKAFAADPAAKEKAEKAAEKAAKAAEKAAKAADRRHAAAEPVPPLADQIARLESALHRSCLQNRMKKGRQGGRCWGRRYWASAAKSTPQRVFRVARHFRPSDWGTGNP